MTTAAPEELLEPIVDRASQLYTLPGVAMEVLRLTSLPYLDTRALKACLENDPALSARILRVVNSSIFGLSRKVTDLAQALGLLGIKPLKMLVLGFSLPRQLWEGAEADTIAWYWRTSLVKAVAARELTTRLVGGEGDDAFLAGLLQDIGVLVLIQDLGSPYLKLLAEARQEPLALAEMEEAALGFSHVEVGARLLDRWGLPPSLVAAVQMPHERKTILRLPLPERPLAQVLHLAALLSAVLDQPAGPAMGELLSAGDQYCRLTFEEVQRVMESVQTKVRDLAGILSLELPAGESYLDLVAAAHRQLADVSAAASVELAWRSKENAWLMKTADLRAELRRAVEAGARRAVTAEAGQRPPARSTEPAGKTTAPIALASAPPLSANPLLVRRVADAVTRCRAIRAPVSLVLVAIDDFPSPSPAGGVPQKLVEAIAAGFTLWTQDRGEVWHLEGGRFALLWEEADRKEAIDLVRHALRAAKAWSASQPPGPCCGLAFSAGVATLPLPPKNFPPQELIEGAERCLTGALLSGGDTVKTIEL
jgi:HD-like signal output (HDOD) protein